MFITDRSRLSAVVIHYIGNALKDEELVLSKEESGLDTPTRKIIWEYVVSAFRTPDFYQFSHAVDVEMNNVFTTSRSLFAEPGAIVKYSADLARLLSEVSQHPNVRSGELMVLYFEQLTFGDFSAPAIGLFKSERKQPFLFTESHDEVIDLYSYQGISPAKVDKAALIFNTDEEEGYQVLSVDNINKGEDAKFWF
ncbi:MAG: nucleoid-associated protein [Owenweeksia sp.]|nr:nucleoid-associated protein [Owenweeksia sp.]